MNILFSTVREHEEKEIFLNKLKNRFNRVEFIADYLPNRKERTIFYKILKNFRKKVFTNDFINNLYDKECRKFYMNKLDSFDCIFDYFFIISREFSKDFIEELKRRMPNIKVILFIWDKLEYTPFHESYKCFDYIFSFDKVDTKNHNFLFRPSFYLDSFREKLIPFHNREYDFYYIGQLREKKRLLFLEKFYAYFKEKDMKFFMKIFNDLKDKSIFVPNELLLTKKISYSENMQKIKNSKVVLDISYKQQTGLTLRCFEALATETKIITDNADILNYDFYNSNNIFYLKDISDIPNIPEEFFKNEYQKIDEEILYKYSIDGFLDDIFNNI